MSLLWDLLGNGAHNLLADIIEQSAPPAELMEDVFTSLRYLARPKKLPGTASLGVPNATGA